MRLFVSVSGYNWLLSVNVVYFSKCDLANVESMLFRKAL